MDRALRCRGTPGEGSHAPQIIDNWIVVALEHRRCRRQFRRRARHLRTARNGHPNAFAHNHLRAVHIRGVYPRGLIEAHDSLVGEVFGAGYIRGVYPRGLIEAPISRRVRSECSMATSAGSTPAASLKLDPPLEEGRNLPDIRGVYPRGLIEASAVPIQLNIRYQDIRGVYPRGLIEAGRRPACSRSNRP